MEKEKSNINTDTITGNCKGCKHDGKLMEVECGHCMRAFSDYYEKQEKS